MKGKRIAFDDGELADWLMDLIADGPENFLQALAEAVVTADADDYGIIRPALIELRRRYGGRREPRLPPHFQHAKVERNRWKLLGK